MWKYLTIILLAFMLTACGNSGIPDEHGVYARTLNGELIRLEKVEEVYNTDADFLNVYAKKRNFSYITSKPKVTIDLYDLEGFIIYGKQPLGTDVLIKYFSDLLELSAIRRVELSNNNGPGDVNEETFIDYGYRCGEVDGGTFKKIEKNMYLFTFPKTESTDYKYCSLAMHKQMGERRLPNPYLGTNFYGWYYDNAYWTFNVANEDKEGKKNELARLKVVEKERQKVIAYNNQQKERIKRYNNAPVISDFNGYLKPLDLIKLSSKTYSNTDYQSTFRVYRHNRAWWLDFGASRTRIKTDGLNKFELDKFIEEAKAETKKVYDNLKSQELKGEVVRLTGLNLPIKMDTFGKIKAEYQDIAANIGYKMPSLERVNLKEQVKTLSPYLANIMASDNREFVSLIRLKMFRYNENMKDGFTLYLKPKDKELISKLGKKDGGKDVITEVTLEFNGSSTMIDSYWKSDLYNYQISSFKLKSSEDLIFLIDPKTEKRPQTFYVYNKKGIQQ